MFLQACIKPQYVDQIPRAVKGTVQAMLDKKDELEIQEEICEEFDLTAVRGRNIEDLSGGELQRFACAVVCIQRADMCVKGVGVSVSVVNEFSSDLQLHV